jgi:hypothetical protein
MTKRLKELIERVENWPPTAQKEAIASLESIEGYVSLGLSDDDFAVLERSEQDVCSGKVASGEKRGAR